MSRPTTYDGLGNITQISSPDTLTSTFKFDSAGNLTKATDARAVVTNYTYDALDRMLTRTYPVDSTLNVSITYDSAAAGYHNAIGHIASLTDQVGSLSRSYDERGNITFDSRTLNGQTYKTGYTYESAGRLSSITYASSGWIVGYGRDSAGQITYVSATPARSCRREPRVFRHAHAVRPGLLVDLRQRRDRHPHLRSRLPHDERDRSRRVEHSIPVLQLERRQPGDGDHRPRHMPPTTRPSPTTAPGRLLSHPGPTVHRERHLQFEFQPPDRRQASTTPSPSPATA